MAIYRAFIDDSGSEDSLFRDDLSPKPIQKMDGGEELRGSVSKASAAGLVVVRGSDLNAVQRELMGLRWDIKRKYKLEGDKPPRLHMRHLWGKKDANTDNGRNPFYHLDERERLNIARKAYQLLSELCKRYDLQVAGGGSLSKETQEGWYRFFHAPEAIICREIIYSRFRSGKHARRFYARITNPTMSTVAELVVAFAQFIKEGSHQGVIRYDTSDASKGFEADEVYDALSSLGWFQGITHSSHGPDADEALLQLADLVSFATFREKLNIARGLPVDGDPAMRQVLQGLEHKVVKLKNPPPPFLSIGVHYLAARQFLHTIDPLWVETHLKSPAQLVAEFQAGGANEQGGIHIVQKTSYDYYVAHGRLP